MKEGSGMKESGKREREWECALAQCNALLKCQTQKGEREKKGMGEVGGGGSYITSSKKSY